MYSLNDLRSAFARPRYVPVELNRAYQRLLSGRRNHRTTAWFDEDWDTLIVLDACRLDYFRDCSQLPGQTEFRYSPGSTSEETIRSVFSDRPVNDTVYVSGNPWYKRVQDDIGGELFRFRLVDPPQSLRAPRPEDVTEAALAEHEEYPNKRLIIHYMQPHQPYLGPTGEKFPGGMDLHQQVMEAGVSASDVEQAYRENLELVLDEVETVFDELDGKTVLTADHGELLGDRIGPLPIRDYGHPGSVFVDQLVKVPWHVYVAGSRREIVEADTAESHQVGADVERRLEELGYRA